jgi:hypothetical protein
MDMNPALGTSAIRFPTALRTRGPVMPSTVDRQSSTQDDQEAAWTAELVPGEHWLLILDASDDSDLPDEEVLHELRRLALQRQTRPTMGAVDWAHVAVLAEAVGTGVAATAVWDGFRSAAGFLQRLRSKHRERITSPEQAQHLMIKLTQTIGQGSAAAAPRVPLPRPDAVLLPIPLQEDGQTTAFRMEWTDQSQSHHVSITIDITGACADLEVRSFNDEDLDL